jgi:hypothetical protein
MTFNWDTLIEAIKEPARLFVLALLSWVITFAVPQLDPKWIPLMTVILKFVDALLHEWGKDTKNDALTLGITRF